MKIINLFKTGILFIILSAIFVAVGYYFGGQNGGLLFFAFSIITNMIMYWFSSTIALRSARAQELNQSQYIEIFDLTKKLSDKMSLPMPKLYLSPEQNLNAFATGRNKNNSVICFTQGILENLSTPELEAVIAHELGHIQNNDILLTTISAMLASGISTIAQLGMYNGSSSKEGGNPIINFIFFILAPLSATILQLAISRSREYAADKVSAYTTKQPQNLINALTKIHHVAQQNMPTLVKPATASLYIFNPLKNSFLNSLFSTHPSLENRIEQLQQYNTEINKNAQ